MIDKNKKFKKKQQKAPCMCKPRLFVFFLISFINKRQVLSSEEEEKTR
jgi:hypothetical protein